MLRVSLLGGEDVEQDRNRKQEGHLGSATPALHPICSGVTSYDSIGSAPYTARSKMDWPTTFESLRADDGMLHRKRHVTCSHTTAAQVH